MKQRCLSCKWWDNEQGEWGVCTLSDPDHQYSDDPTPIRARTVNGMYESVVETHKDFSCSEYDPYEDHNV